MKYLIFFYIAVFCIYAISCKSSKGIISKTDPGWQTFNYPRTTMPPGYVFRIPDKEKIPQEVTVLKANKSFDTGYAFIPRTVSERTINSNVFARFLFLNTNDSTLNASFNKNKKVSFSIGKAFSESFDELTIDSLVQHSNIHWRDNNSYYIIQATMSTKEINFSSNNNGGLNAKSILNFKTVNSSASFSTSKKDSTVLIETFDERYRIYYFAWKINPMGAASGNTKIFTYEKNIIAPVFND